MLPSFITSAKGFEKIHYMDVTSMFPFVMSDPRYYYPVKEPTVLIKGRDTLMPIDKVFGVMKVLIEAPDNLYFPVLPERSVTQKKVMYHLKTMTGTWSSVEIQKAVRVGYKVLDIYKQHHFPEKRNDLFRAYNETFFNIKRQAKADGNKGLEAIAKLCINSPYGKWGYNPSKAKGSRIVTETNEFSRYMFGIWNEVSINILEQGRRCRFRPRNQRVYRTHQVQCVYFHVRDSVRSSQTVQRSLGTSRSIRPLFRHGFGHLRLSYR